MAEAKGKGDKEPDRQKTVFVITPIGGANSPEREHADFVLHGAIEPVFKERGYRVLRADTMADPAMINDGIFNAIFEADICVADLTFTNANVFYELGVRHTLLKPVIHIADEETRLPFDTAQHRAIMFRRSNWASFETLKAGLLAQLETIEEEGFKVSNPITHARGRIEIANSGDDRDKLISDLMTRMDQMEQATRGLRSLQTRNVLAHLPPPDPKIVNRLFGTLNDDDVNTIEAVLQYVTEIQNVPGVSLDKFKRNLERKIGARMRALTNSGESFLYETLERSNVSHSFVEVVRDVMSIA